MHRKPPQPIEDSQAGHRRPAFFFWVNAFGWDVTSRKRKPPLGPPIRTKDGASGVGAPASNTPIVQTLHAETSSAIALTVSSIGTFGSTRC